MIYTAEHPESRFMEVLFDGQPKKYVKQACPDEGWADVIVVDEWRGEDGIMRVRARLDEHHQPLVQRICGKVEIRMKARGEDAQT